MKKLMLIAVVLTLPASAQLGGGIVCTKTTHVRPCMTMTDGSVGFCTYETNDCKVLSPFMYPPPMD